MADPSAYEDDAARPTGFVMTEEQLSTLITNITSSQSEANRLLLETLAASARISPGPGGSSTPAPSMFGTQVSQPGNFSRCTARFNGVTRNADDLEAFIDAVEIYKDCANVSDEHALRGLPMLLVGDAAVWWRGIKSSVQTWKDALVRLRGMYGVPRPAYKVLRDVFTAEQRNDERTDQFVSRLRSLLSVLPYSVCDIMKTDIVYGLLDRKIRKRVPRESVDGLDKLIEAVRVVEEALLEVSDYTHFKSSSDGLGNPPTAVVNPSNAIENNVNKNNSLYPRVNNTIIPKRIRLKCSYCKLFGHSVNDCRKKPRSVNDSDTNNTNSLAVEGESPNGIRCYGCGQLGVIRSKCEKCKGASTPKADFRGAHFDCNEEMQPTVFVDIVGRRGAAILDTGATHCIAGPTLYRLLREAGVEFVESNRTVGLADGSQQLRTTLICTTDVSLQGRTIPTTFMVFPGADTRTLLGKDFIMQAGLVLDLPQGAYSFNSDPRRIYFFLDKYELRTTDDTELMRMDVAKLNLRSDEGTKLTTSQRAQLNTLLISKAVCFAAEGPPTEYAEHHIKVSESQNPIASPPYRMSPNKRKILEEELEKLLDADIIEECESPWAANVVLVAKKDGGVRLCVDYRKLNAVTEPDRYPLPRIEDVLHAAKTSNYMTTCDLRSGYFQVAVAPCDRDKTAFITPLGTFRFKRMPMGLRNSGATFQRLIDRFKSGKSISDVSLLAYLDDLVILSGTFEQHLKDLEAVFDRLAMFKLRINREKSHFARESVKFLGHIIVPGGIQIDPEKTAAISNMPAPKDVRHLKTFLQTSSWFRRFIPDYAEVARPLTGLLKKRATWTWSTPQQEAFEKIKALLTSSPILRQADETKTFILRTDSSAYCLGAVLMQGDGNDERPVEYASRLLTSPERNYSTTEREALAVVWAVTKFRGYIEGSDVIVKSDHQPLRWLMSLKSPSGRLARWALILQEYNLQIEYTPGRCNAVADTLSRPPCTEDTRCDLCYAEVDLPSRSPRDVRENQLKDSELRKIVEDLEATDDPFRGRAWADKGYVISDGVLYRYGPEIEDEDAACLVVPTHERMGILANYHDAPTAGHVGVERTLSRLCAKYYWPGMRQVVTDYVKRCVACQRYKADNKKPAGLLLTPAMTRRFEVVAVDLFGPLPETPDNSKWILIVEDVCSRWIELFALQNATGFECAKTLISEVFLRYGVPRRVLSDNGVQFISDVMQQVCHVFGISQTLTPKYHPQANPVERKNRDLKPQLAILVGQDHTTWDKHLPAIRFAMNSAITSSTGYTPAYLTFGREMRAPADVVSEMRTLVESDNAVTSIAPHLRMLSKMLLNARDVHEKAQATYKRYADEGRRLPPDYSSGDLVLLKTQGANDAGKGQTPKFIPRRDGPYRVRDILSPVTYSLERIGDGELLGTYHVSQLTPFIGDVQPPIREKRKRGRPRRYDL